MHEAVAVYVRDAVERYGLGGDVLDLGGRDVNGTTRPYFPAATSYTVVDISEHDSVDIVCDAADLDLEQRFDVVVSSECLEHAERAPEIVATAFRHLKPGGAFVATMAGEGRGPHGAHGAPTPPDGEFYRNVTRDELDRWLMAAGFLTWLIDVDGLDIRCVAFRGL